MNKSLFLTLAATFLIAIFIIPINADPMSSASYHNISKVVSGGGSSTGSIGFMINTTMGQPSPVINPVGPLLSSNFDLLSVFWYTPYSTVGSDDDCIPDLIEDADQDGIVDENEIDPLNLDTDYDSLLDRE